MFIKPPPLNQAVAEGSGRVPLGTVLIIPCVLLIWGRVGLAQVGRNNPPVKILPLPLLLSLFLELLENFCPVGLVGYGSLNTEEGKQNEVTGNAIAMRPREWVASLNYVLYRQIKGVIV